ncbi:MAG TPA: ABC transporter ATP-binding protein [Acidimicrobiales bacterium]|nr:ABC transporter ATP-binding protein [Acidimicrobiales bacterium]
MSTSDALPTGEPGVGDGAPLLDVRDLRTAFDAGGGSTVRAVDGVSLTLERGRTLGVVGESGSGKTVLSRSIMHLFADQAGVTTEGEIWFDGRDLRALRRPDLRDVWGKEIAMVFQDPMTSLNPVRRVGVTLSEAMRRHLGLSRSAAAARAVSLLEEVGIPSPQHQMRAYPHQLSGGMRQRVMIASALSCGPKLLVADEPTTALDVTVQAQILDLIDREQRERFMAVILITHDLSIVASRADAVAVMYAGEVVEHAAADSLFSRTRHPYTEALVQAIPRVEDEPHQRLFNIPGMPPQLAAPPTGCRFADRCRYAQDRCVDEHPPVDSDAQADGHVARCFYPVGSDEGREALERNAARGANAVGTPVQLVAKRPSRPRSKEAV